MEKKIIIELVTVGVTSCLCAECGAIGRRLQVLRDSVPAGFMSLCDACRKHWLQVFNA